jgi:hypothetical protein
MESSCSLDETYLELGNIKKPSYFKHVNMWMIILNTNEPHATPVSNTLEELIHLPQKEQG